MMVPIRSTQVLIFRLMVMFRLLIRPTRLSGGKNNGSCESVTCWNDMSLICSIRMERSRSVKWDVD
jgi:hypothetical protein